MVKLEITADAFAKQVKKLSGSNIPKATVVAMNRCAYHARQRLVDELPSKFKIKRDWVKRQISYKKTTLHDWPKCKVRVGTAFKSMWYQEHGGERKQRTWPGYLVPLTSTTDEHGKRMSDRPFNLIKKRYYAVIKHKGREFLIFRNRQIKGNRRGVDQTKAPEVQKRKTLFLYVLEKKVTTKPKWNLESVVHDEYLKKFSTFFKEKILGPSGP